MRSRTGLTTPELRGNLSPEVIALRGRRRSVFLRCGLTHNACATPANACKLFPPGVLRSIPSGAIRPLPLAAGFWRAGWAGLKTELGVATYTQMNTTSLE